MIKITRKLFKHGGSQAINLPKEFVRDLSSDEVIAEVSPDKIVIRKKPQMETMESDPLFTTFIQAIATDAMKHPEKLHNLDDAWKDLDAILKDLPDIETDE